MIKYVDLPKYYKELGVLFQEKMLDICMVIDDRSSCGICSNDYHEKQKDGKWMFKTSVSGTDVCSGRDETHFFHHFLTREEMLKKMSGKKVSCIGERGKNLNHLFVSDEEKHNRIDKYLDWEREKTWYKLGKINEEIKEKEKERKSLGMRIDKLNKKEYVGEI